MAAHLEKYAFGWIEPPWQVNTPEFETFPVEDHAERVAEVLRGAIVTNTWIYPPHIERQDKHTAGFSVRWMLPSTHYLRLSPALNDAQFADDFVLILGFLLGLNLKPAGMGHLHRTARAIGHLVNFACVGRDLELAARRAIEFYAAHRGNPEVLTLTRAAFHWYLTAQSYHHAFEKFTFQYMVLDNAHRLSELLHPTYAALGGGHTQRPLNLASFYGIPLPPPFQTVGAATPDARKLAKTRNNLVHEALWLGHPLGYASDGESWDTTMNLIHFNSQLLLAVLGIECKFRTLLYSAQTTGLDVVP